MYCGQSWLIYWQATFPDYASIYTIQCRQQCLSDVTCRAFELKQRNDNTYACSKLSSDPIGPQFAVWPWPQHGHPGYPSCWVKVDNNPMPPPPPPPPLPLAPGVVAPLAPPPPDLAVGSDSSWTDLLIVAAAVAGVFALGVYSARVSIRR